MPPSAAKLISAVNHPLRRRILAVFLGGSLECASAAEVAEILDERVAQVAYHLKTLENGGILQRDGRGAGQEACYGWALDVEPEWLRVVLEVWAEAEVAG